MGVPEERYSKIVGKNQREICLLRAFPCAWGKCAFCDYIEDNGRDTQAMVSLNHQVLQQVTGEFGVLEVINSGSCFELPEETLDEIAEVIREKMRRRMPVPIVFKTGVETFDYDFRERVLNKHADFTEPEQVAKYFDSPCLMVGIKGQTKDMIRYDIQCLKKYFKLGTVNVYNNNTTSIRRDEELVAWFMEEYRWLLDDPSVEVLYEITDFGVG